MKKLVTCREFDGLLRRDSDDLWNEATVQSKESFVFNHLAETVKAVAIHHLIDGLSQTLVLHSCLYKVDRIHRCRSDSWTERKNTINNGCVLFQIYINLDLSAEIDPVC